MKLKDLFIPFEKLIFNGIEDGRVAMDITEHGVADIKSVYGMDGYEGTPQPLASIHLVQT